MSDFESALNSILSSPEQMEQIMGIARSLSGESQPSENEESAAQSPQQGISLPGLGNLDPKTLGILTRIMGEFSSQSSDKAALVAAMKPFLHEERYSNLNKALTITKIVRAARTAMKEMGGEKLV